MVLKVRFGFPREHRIIASSGFASVRRTGRRFVTRSFILYVVPASLGVSRLGIIASRKVGDAVARNRAKRVLREVFRLNREQLGLPLDVVAIVRRGSRRPEYWRYERDFLQGISLYKVRSGTSGSGG